MLKSIGMALGRIPSGLFVLTAKNEHLRTGMLASWVQQVSFKPPMVSVAVAKGRYIMPLISESRRFGLCQLPQGEKIIMRKFASSGSPTDDPFLGFEMINDTVTNVPILANVLSYLECDLTCHMDVEGDHDIFIGTICGGDLFNGDPHVHLARKRLKLLELIPQPLMGLYRVPLAACQPV